MLIITPRSPLRAVFDFGRGETIRMALSGQHIKFNVSRPGWRPLHIACRLSPKSPSRSTLISKANPALVKRSSRSFVRYASSQGPEKVDQGKMVQPPATPATEDPESAMQEKEDSEDVTESPYTIPNALTLARIIACPFLGYQIVQGDYVWATSLLFACGVSDWLDGYLARHWGGKSVLGSILDPAADKLLMTTLVVTLAWANLLPVPLAVLILGRDVGLSFWAFYVRYTSLPPPRTLSRYFNPSISSAEAKPTQISKLNTALQLILMGVTTVSPLLSLPLAVPLQALQWTVAGTTIWSGLSYVNKAGFKLVPKKGTFRLKKRE